MALFFDAGWFDQRLAAMRLSRADLGRVLGIGPADVEALFKDQREVRPEEIALLAGLLGAHPSDIVERAGIQGPPRGARAAAPAGEEAVLRRLEAIETRLGRIEALLLSPGAQRSGGKP
ncbi:MAG: DNA-binding protein [Alphaproteobacteria bacterium]|nr:DNA-binding protein [Alphaproteobacteria bacterium]